MTDLPERLREAAAAHRPDRERMLARVEHAMAVDGAGAAGHEEARGHDRPAPWMRVGAVTAAVAGAIGLGGLAVGAVTGDSGAPGTSVTSGGPESSQPTPSASSGGGSADGRVPVRRPSESAPAHRKNAEPPPTADHLSPTAAPPEAPSSTVGSTSSQQTGGGTGGGGGGTTTAPPPQASGPLQSNGVVDSSSDSFWAQSNVELTSQRVITSLTVELRIAVVNGEKFQGSFTTVSQTQVRTYTANGFLVYRWTLTAGQTIPAGSYTFAGQFSHDQGQGGTDGDGYTVTAGFSSGSPVTLAGHF